MDDQHKTWIEKTNAVHLRIMEVVAYAFVAIYAAITASAILNNERDLMASMKDATVNIAMIIIGYVFGSSAGSKAKEDKLQEVKP